MGEAMRELMRLKGKGEGAKESQRRGGREGGRRERREARERRECAREKQRMQRRRGAEKWAEPTVWLLGSTHPPQEVRDTIGLVVTTEATKTAGSTGRCPSEDRGASSEILPKLTPHLG
jgi:isoaspartyl peptidase/L-asparaginase-like protein (Ntn-hydrolase superfamily)